MSTQTSNPGVGSSDSFGSVAFHVSVLEAQGVPPSLARHIVDMVKGLEAEKAALCDALARADKAIACELAENRKLQRGAVLYDFEAFVVAQERRLREASSPNNAICSTQLSHNTQKPA